MLEKENQNLPPNFSEAGLRFNLAHSRDHALLAVTRGLSVGIDIEFIDPKRGVDEIANRFFSRQEDSTWLCGSHCGGRPGASPAEEDLGVGKLNR
jgi:phosphopantetheinyl transferase